MARCSLNRVRQPLSSGLDVISPSFRSNSIIDSTEAYSLGFSRRHLRKMSHFSLTSAATNPNSLPKAKNNLKKEEKKINLNKKVQEDLT
jgi:hypothetical protein